MTGSDECCGFGGLFSIKNAEISTAMGRRKTLRCLDSGADVVALCDVSCMTHINGLLSRQAQRVRAVHIAQLLTNEVDVEPAPAAEVEKTATAPPRRWQDTK
jgi:L-lactate dehydrogenase complex protein LldE